MISLPSTAVSHEHDFVSMMQIVPEKVFTLHLSGSIVTRPLQAGSHE
jgi:hypothetical protein